MKDTKVTAVSNAPMDSQKYNLLMNGVIEVASNTDVKAFFDDLLDAVWAHVDRHAGSAALGMSHHLLGAVEREGGDIVAKFDAVDYLSSEEIIAEYLTAAFADENPDVFLTAVTDVARARGISDLAQRTGLSRASLYKALTPGAKPRYDTIFKVLHGLGVKVTITAV